MIIAASKNITHALPARRACAVPSAPGYGQHSTPNAADCNLRNRNVTTATSIRSTSRTVGGLNATRFIKSREMIDSFYTPAGVFVASSSPGHPQAAGRGLTAMRPRLGVTRNQAQQRDRTTPTGITPTGITPTTATRTGTTPRGTAHTRACCAQCCDANSIKVDRKRESNAMRATRDGRRRADGRETPRTRVGGWNPTRMLPDRAHQPFSDVSNESTFDIFAIQKGVVN